MVGDAQYYGEDDKAGRQDEGDFDKTFEEAAERLTALGRRRRRLVMPSDRPERLIRRISQRSLPPLTASVVRPATARLVRTLRYRWLRS